METVSGSFIYRVESKKNNKQHDYIYNLTNGKEETTPFNLKSLIWGFFDEEHDETFLEQ